LTGLGYDGYPQGRYWRSAFIDLAQIKTTQDIATLIRDLQELWLFGGLDTLTNPADEEANREKAFQVAEMIEVLAQQKPDGSQENGSGEP
jgi:hypothetical protein